MKKLLISLAALMFATLLFSQGDSNDVNDNLTKKDVVKMQTRFQKNS